MGTPRSPLKSIPEFFRDWVMSKSIGGGDSIMLRTPPKKLSLDDSNYFNERLKDYKNEFKQNNLPILRKKSTHESHPTSTRQFLKLITKKKRISVLTKRANQPQSESWYILRCWCHHNVCCCFCSLSLIFKFMPEVQALTMLLHFIMQT